MMMLGIEGMKLKGAHQEEEDDARIAWLPALRDFALRVSLFFCLQHVTSLVIFLVTLNSQLSDVGIHSLHELGGLPDPVAGGSGANSGTIIR
jgi:hypothetical protein